MVGVGQIGRRYLQGLVNCSIPLRIFVVDPSSSSIELAKAQWLDFGGIVSHHEVLWFDRLPAFPNKFDLALILTSSHVRAQLVHEISQRYCIAYWVLEKVLAQSLHDLQIIQSSITKSEGAWVNTPRRMMPWYQELKDTIGLHAPFQITFSGGLWGLACNSIHFIDLACWLSEEILISVETDQLKSGWFASKRDGFWETTGTLIAKFSAGTTLKLSSFSDCSSNLFTIQSSDGSNWEIHEKHGIARNGDGGILKGQFEFQSQISGRMVENILTSGECKLPTVSESCAMHIIFIEALIKDWNFHNNTVVSSVPIT